MTRRLDEVIERAEVAKAARLALPKVPLSQLARSLGISVGQLRHYLDGKMKAHKAPAWSRTFYASAAALAYGDKTKAAAGFRSLADELEGKIRRANTIVL